MRAASLDRARLDATLRHLDTLSEAEAYGEADPKRQLELLTEATKLRRRAWDDRNASVRQRSAKQKRQAA